jgi:hypothetical protein
MQPIGDNHASHSFRRCLGSPGADRYSYVTRSAIEEHEQDSYRRLPACPHRRDARCSIERTGAIESAAAAVRDLLPVSFGIVRVGLYVCGEHYGIVGNVFWEQLRPEWFWRIVYWHELFELVKKTFSKFSASDRTTFLRVVRELKGEWNVPEEQDKLDDCQRRDVLHAAAGQRDGEVDAEYDRLVRLCGPVRERIDFHAYHTSGWVGERTPVSSDALASMSSEALGSLLRDFAPAQNAWDAPTYRGFADALSAAVRARTTHYRPTASLLMPGPYQHGLLRVWGRWAVLPHPDR